MPTFNREQRTILLEQRYQQFRVVLTYFETDEDGTKLKAEVFITKSNVHSWRILEKLLDSYTSHIMNIRFDGDTLQVRYLVPASSPVFCNVFDYIVSLYEAKQEK